MKQEAPQPIELFYSYAHEDQVLRDTLDKHLSLLRRQGLIAPWHDRDIHAGTEWKQEIDEHLNTADLILLLISPDFLASDYCYDIEMQRAMERYECREARVIPVILRPCDWQSTDIGKLQALPRDGQAMTTWANQDEAFLEVEQSLRAIIEQPYRAQRSTLSSSMITKNREAKLLRLQRMYQELLSSSLQETAWIELGLTEQPGAVQNAANLILHRATQPERPLSPDTSVLQIYQEANCELLILGNPGAGKSTLLYQLGRDLLRVATEQPTEPLPVLFPLSSWAQKRLPLGEWLIEQLLSPLYQVPRRQSQQWVQNERILPLLDGLDEMPEQVRPACIAAINTYRREHPLCPLVVCSRSAEYTTASAQGRLQLACAIELQPLSSAQLDTALALAGKSVAALRVELKKNKELRELAMTPLWLNVLLLTFKNTPVHTLSRQRSVLQQQVCERYVQRMVEEKGQWKCYPLLQTTRWLTFLAGQMRQHSQTAFAVELLQPDWLRKRLRMRYYRSVSLLFGLSSGLLSGPTFGVALSSFSGPIDEPLFVLFSGMFFGLSFYLMLYLLAKLSTKRVLVENRRQSWKGTRSSLLHRLFLILLVKQSTRIALTESLSWSWKGALSGLLVGLPISLSLGIFFGLSSGFRSLILVLVLSLSGGLIPKQDIERHLLEPGEGLRRSLRNRLPLGLLIGAFYSLWFVSLSNRLLVGPLPIFLLVGLIISSFAVIQHFFLRFWLWRSGVFPFRAIAFLEDCCARHFLRRMGGSYQFVHRLLLEYFADIDDAPSATTESPADHSPHR